MSATAQHTPTPWARVAARPGLEPDVAITSGAKIVAEVFVRIHGSTVLSLEERDANAALIVRAVNSHEALVAACKLAYSALGTLMNEVTGKRATDWGKVNDADVAIRKALVEAGAWGVEAVLSPPLAEGK